MPLWEVSNVVTPLGWLECGYRNSSDRMVIARCIGPEAFFLERVVFPFELLSFSCPPDSELKIWTHGLGGPELLDSADVADLVIEPGKPASAETPPTEAPSAGVAAAPPKPVDPATGAAGSGPELALSGDLSGALPAALVSHHLAHGPGGLGIGGGDLVQAWGAAG